MEKLFTVDVEGFEFELEVSIEFSCHSQDDGAEIDSIAIFNGEVEVSHDLISKEDFARIEAKAQTIADDNSYEAYQDYVEGQADRAYDNWKDSQMESDNE